MRLNLTNVCDDDIDWLCQLTRESYRDMVLGQFGVWDDEKERQKVTQKWSGGYGHIVEIDGVRIGALLVEDRGDHDLLREIQIIRRCQRRGIGSYLIGCVIGQARQRQRPLRLRVLFTNGVAKNLYEKLGFKIVGENAHQHLMEIV